MIKYILLAASYTANNLVQSKPSSSRRVLCRPRDEANKRLMRDYFNEQPVYNEKKFRRRFRMSKRLFLKITSALEEKYSYFTQRANCSGKLGFTAIQKCTSSIRLLAYGSSVDSFDEYLAMSERTSRDTLTNFCKGIIEMYGAVYLRRPTWSDLQRIYEVHENTHGFPGMIGSIDCMHWEWDACPVAWRGSHTRGDIGVPSLMLQAVASYDLWIWNAYFGQQGSNNDINVFEASPVLEEIISGLAPTSSFHANGNEYRCGYYLCDGIYPEYATFVKTFTDPIHNKRKYFKKKQESARKDIERAFGVLKKRWHVISNPSRYWEKEKMKDVIYTCIILHNMILEDEGKAICQNYDASDPSLDPTYWTQETSFAQRIQNLEAVKSRQTHNMLMADLVEHLWSNHPPSENENFQHEDVELNIGEYVSDDDDME